MTAADVGALPPVDLVEVAPDSADQVGPPPHCPGHDDEDQEEA
ncbi:hypothetical protein [Actinoplanes italicus]|uniref:Uncharacterized protein n=1 Tax=Actinoplanes italicus TaxID=113567 RepID=A0A2T0KIV2_9ACTN|nr:hypothetical protein [Actinoplanes italicus]PRX23455.1 hypothetical protein CLV67_103203 [Actinoplanes italicus]